MSKTNENNDLKNQDTAVECCGGKSHNDPNHVCRCKEAVNQSATHSYCRHNHTNSAQQPKSVLEAEAITNLEDTIALMTSTNFRDRLRAEYWQTKLRYENLKRLNDMIELSEYGVIEFTKDALKTPKELFRAQQRAMGEYLHILELRAIAEKISL